MFSLFKQKPLKKTNKFGKFAILIPARNESKVIEKLFKSIKNQTYDQNLIDVYVVTESEDDLTNQIALKYGYNYFVRKDLENKRTKGYALDELIKDIYFKNLSYDAFFIFDADNMLKENFIEEMNKAYQSGIEVGMGYRNTVNIHDGWVASCSALLFANINTFQNLARNKITKSIVISGTGFYISSKIIDKFKCFPFNSLTEDYEFSTYMLLNNVKSKYITTTEFYDEQPTTVKVLNKQRVRWIRGYFDVKKQKGKELTKTFFKKGSNKLAIIETKVGVLPNIVFIVSFLLYLFTLLILIVISLLNKNFDFLQICGMCFVKVLVTVYLLLTGFTLLQILIENNKFNLTFKEISICLVLNPIFIFLFVYQAIRAIFTKKVEWKVVEHKVNVENINIENQVKNKTIEETFENAEVIENGK